MRERRKGGGVRERRNGGRGVLGNWRRARYAIH